MGGGVCRWREREIIYLSLHCHHQNDSYIKKGSDESHFNISLIVREEVSRQCPQTTTFEDVHFSELGGTYTHKLNAGKNADSDTEHHKPLTQPLHGENALTSPAITSPCKSRTVTLAARPRGP